jgi:Ca-activated chloride channel family protein
MPDSDAPLHVTFDLDREVASRHTPSDLRVVVGLKAAGTNSSAERLPISVVLAIDVSASMSGQPLRQVARSAERIAALLRPEDQLGVVAFSDAAFEMMNLRPANDAMRQELHRALCRLSTQSRTNVEAGLRSAYAMLDRCTATGHSLAVLLSDGHPNVGASSASTLTQIAIASAATTATLGYGPHHDDQVLGAIADGGRGRYAFIPDPQLCQLELARAIGSHSEAAVVDVQARIAARNGATLRWVAGPSVQQRGPESVIGAPDLAAGATTVLAAAFTTVPSSTARAIEVADVVVSYRVPSESQPRSVTRRIEIPTGEASTPARPGPVRAALLAESGLRRREAWELADAGRWEEAEALLRDIADRIERAPNRLSDTPLHEAFEQLIDDIELVRRKPNQAVYAAYRRGQRELDEVRVASDYGRALLADAAGDIPRAQLLALDGPNCGTQYSLRAENSLGRSGSSDICVADAGVSRRHTSIVAADGAFWAVDCGSTNTTRVNGRPIDRQLLVDGDVLELGAHRFRYCQR